MNTDSIRKLWETMARHRFAELDLRVRDQRIRMVLSPTREQPGSLTTAEAPAEAESGPISCVVRSEKVGLFSFGKVRLESGASVKKGQLLGSIKGVSMQDQVVAPQAGCIEEILVEEGAIVEFGQPLFQVKTDAPSDL